MISRMCKLFAAFILCIVVSWIGLVGLYISIPSPATTIDTGTFTSDRPLVRVFDSRSANLDIKPGDNDREYSILEFRYLQDSRTLQFGGGLDLVDKINGFLEPDSSPSIPVPYYNISLDDLGAHVSVSTSIEMTIPTGDKTGELIPDGIELADAVLLFWWANHDVASLEFRIRKFPHEKLVEIWPASEKWGEDTGNVGLFRCLVSCTDFWVHSRLP